MGVSGIQEHFVAQYQRVGNTKIDLYTLDRHQREKQQNDQSRLQKADSERIRQARLDNNNLGQNVDVYC